jgi:hypothetical protein|tara:strand:- start:7696 stop:8013 length:318 start_codon:yes stop_codon:yes gene_type:complete
MSLEKQFLKNGSTYGAGQGGNSADLQSERDAIIGDKKLSKLHFDYSINGVPEINRKGVPKPSLLDLNGQNPSAPNRDGAVSPINNTFSEGTYKNSVTGPSIGRIG